MNYQDIIAQALRAGFKPYAGNSSQMQALVNGLEVTPYMETVGQTEQDPGTSRQMGYTVSTPLGGTRYRTDVVDMDGNLQRSNVHDAGADKYGLGDMAKLAAFAVGANALGAALGQPSMFGGGGLLGNGNGLGLDWYADQPLTKLGTPLQESAAMFNPVAAPDLAASLPSASVGAEAVAAGSVAPSAALSSADKAAMFSNSGYGPGMSGLQTSAFDSVLGATGSNTLAKLASDAAGTGLGSALGSASGKVIGGLLGAVAGAANSGDKTQTTQQRLDPRMEAMLYGADGKGGYLGAATDWFNQNKGGNPLMLQGAQMMADFYKNPQYAEGYNALRSAGLGLLNTPMAGNPFMRG